jgi:aspartate/methionine/tyrosine aminotransferase
LRSGFAVGDREILAALNRVRLNGTSCTPLPLLAAATALWSEDGHVESMRGRLRHRKDMADELLGGFPGYYRPPCGFFLWIEVDDGLALTQRLWRDFALKVLPGAYLTQPDAAGANAGHGFVRIALVHDPDTTREGLGRIAGALGVFPDVLAHQARASVPLAKGRKWA